MPSRGCGHLAVTNEALLDDTELVGVTPMSATRDIGGRQHFNLRIASKVDHKVGSTKRTQEPSDGSPRKVVGRACR